MMHPVAKNISDPSRPGGGGGGNSNLYFRLFLHNAFDQTRSCHNLTHRHTMKKVALLFRGM